LVDPSLKNESFWKNVRSGSILTVNNMKVRLYGSFINDGKENHDTLNQFLTSTDIHEVIG
jgi:hypothetical protein